MSNEENENLEVEALIDAAEDYADLALKHLMLEKIIEPPTDYELGDGVTNEDLRDAVKSIGSFVSHWASHYPHAFMSWNYREKLEVHYLFPNLSAEEREPIERMKSVAVPVGGKPPDDHAMKEWKKASISVEKFESKLTAMQLAILETEKFRPKPNQ